jgi:hypothetical protein
MQVLLVLLAIVGSTAWLAMDASKRDWSENGFAKNVPTWVAGSLLLWIVIFPLYVFVHRKNAPLLKGAEAKPDVRPEPVVALEAAEPAEQYGPSLDEVALAEPEPEPVVEVLAEPVVEIEPEPEPVVEILTEPTIEPEPEPVVESLAERTIEIQPEPMVEILAEPVVEPEPEPMAEPEPVAAIEPILEISHPELPAEQAPPGLSVDAFKDIKPVAFGGVAPDDDVPEPTPEPVVEQQPEPYVEPAPEPVVEQQPEPYVAPEPEPYVEPEPAPEPEPAIAAAVAEPVADEPKAKKRGLRLPNPELKLPSFGKKSKKDKPAVATSDAPKESKPKRGPKLPQITLPANLQGPLNDVERKIALGSVVAIVAAAAFGYSTAPAEDAVSPAPVPAPAAASR